MAGNNFLPYAWKSGKKAVNITHPEDFTRFTGSNQVWSAAYSVANNTRQTCRQGFVHNQSPRFAPIAWENQTIRRSIRPAHFRLVQETGPGNTCSKFLRFGATDILQRTGADH